MSVSPGRMLSHYRLIEKIGEGGMGLVWKALDTTLDREVAVKILPDVFSDHPERLARFEREAKLLASLNHPNIAVIHGLHEADGLRFLAMELVSGEDLAQRLARGPLPLEEALRTAKQVAEALETAHENGVIHRDLKPANIQLTPDGQVKVLDFGLAKAFEADPASTGTSPTMSPTLTSAGTVAGMILGTAAYMSPEQARGQAVDKRSDIWAFGSVLYEMLTGRQAFAGDTVSDTLAGVLKIDPDWDALPAGTPRRIRRLLARCLHKDPKQRLHDVADVRIVIEEALSGAPEEDVAIEAAPQPGIARRERVVWIGALVLVAAAAGVLAWMLKPANPPPLRKFELAIQNLEGGYPVPPVISPDGSRLAYIAESKLWVRDLDQLESREVAGSDGARAPFWSPDGAFVAYAANGKLWKVPAEAGQSILICDLPGTLDAGAWGPEDRIVFTPSTGPMYEVSARGGDPRALLETEQEKETDFHKPHFLPDGSILFAVHRFEGIDTLAVYDGKQRKVLLQVEGARLDRPLYSPTGHILYHRATSNDGVWAAPFSVAKLELTGEPFMVAPAGNWPSASTDGTLIYMRGAGTSVGQLVWVDRQGKVEGNIGQPQPGLVLFPAISPNQRRVAVAANENENWDVWIHDADRGTRTRLTFDPAQEFSSDWSAAGERLVYSSGQIPSNFDLLTRAADGTGDRSTLTAGYYPTVSPDGKLAAYTLRGEETQDDLWYVPLDGDPEPTVFLQTPAREREPQLSPDGRYLAYSSDESGRSEIYLKKFPGGEGKWQVSVDGGRYPRWSRTSGELFFRNEDTLMVVEVSTEPSVMLGTPRELFSGRPNGLLFQPARRYDVAADGQRFVMVQQVGESVEAPGITVVENWFAEFDERD